MKLSFSFHALNCILKYSVLFNFCIKKCLHKTKRKMHSNIEVYIRSVQRLCKYLYLILKKMTKRYRNALEQELESRTEQIRSPLQLRWFFALFAYRLDQILEKDLNSWMTAALKNAIVKLSPLMKPNQIQCFQVAVKIALSNTYHSQLQYFTFMFL